MPWFGVWGLGPWFIFPILPILMCIGMMAVMLLVGRGHKGRGHSGLGRMGWCGGGHVGEAHGDPALETLRQQFASGELTEQEYEEQRDLLLRV